MVKIDWLDDDFVIDETCLKKGAFGIVYKAQHKPTKTNYAIKKIKQNEALQEIENMNIVLGLKHEYIVSYHGYFRNDEFICIVMDYYDYDNLREAFIEKKLKPPDESIRAWIKQLMNVLSYMELKKVYHNDIKPDNILLNTAKNSIVLVDLGELQIRDDSKTLSIRGGTTVYMSPERAQGGESTIASEMWSFGIVIYEIIHFKRPIENQINGKIIYEETPFRSMLDRILEAKSYLERPLPAEVEQMLDLNRPKIIDRVDDKKILSDIPKSEFLDHMNIVNLEFLDDLLKTANILLISGEAGAGKTTLAQRYGIRFSEEKKEKDAVVVWIYSENKSSLMEMINTMALRVIKLNNEIDKSELKEYSLKEKIKAITEYIQKRTNPHLFIFDNIEEENMDTIKFFVDSMNTISNLKIILTSKNSKINQNFDFKIGTCRLEQFKIEPLHIKKLFVEKLARRKISPSIIDLIYVNISDKLVSLNPYFINKSIDTILELGYSGLTKEDVPKIVAEIENIKTSEYLFSHLSQREECTELMNLLPFMNPDKISVKLLQKLSEDDKSIIEGTKTLEKYSIITSFLEEDVKYIKIHRLSMKALKEKIQKENNYSNLKSKIVKKYHTIFDQAYVELDDEYDEVKLKDAMIHLEKICGEKVTNLEVAQLLEKYIDFKTQDWIWTYKFQEIIKRQKELCDYFEKIITRAGFKTIYNHCKLLYLRSKRTSQNPTLREIKEQEERIACFRENDEVKDNVIKAYYHILYSYSEKNLVEEKKNCFYNLIKLIQKPSTALSNKYRILIAKLNKKTNPYETIILLEESSKYYEQYYKVKPNDEKFADNIRLIADEIKDLDGYKAIEYYQLALEKYKNYFDKNPDGEEFADNIRLIADEIKDLDGNKAIEYYQLALET